jgi:L-threonylcarbamoyladenylate synthase
VGPRMVDVRMGEPAPDLLDEVVSHLRRQGMVAMPTETVYGFSCLLQDPPLREVRRLKGREGDRPFLVLVPDAASVSDLAWSAQARELAEVFWPGALTLVLRDPLRRFPEAVRSREDGVAVRVSPHPVARAVVEGVGEPMVSTSANPPGGSPALSAREALSAAVALGAGDTLWVLDGGILGPSEPSTIVDCTGPEPLVLRAGAVPVYRLRCVLPEVHGPV